MLSKFKPYTYEEERIEMWQVPTGATNPITGKPEMTVREQHIVKTKKTVMPDTTAIIFFLKSKAGWRDNADIQKGSSITAERRKELEDFFNAQQT